MKPANAGKKYPAETLTKDEVHRLLKACGRGYAGARLRAQIVVMWRCGLRVAETLALYPKDVDLDNGSITVMHGKGDRRRVVGIDPEACAVIERWLERRRVLGLTARYPLFCVISRPNIGKPQHASVVREAIKDAAKRAGLTDEGKRVHPHGLRHTHAFELATEGIPVHVIRAQLGHASLATTDRYINHLNPRTLIETMRARTWEPPATHPAAS